MPQFLKSYIITLIVATFGFVAVYETVFHLVNDQPAEVECYLDNESSKSEKENEKEKEKEIEKRFIDQLSLNISEPVLILDNFGLYRGKPDAVQDYYSEITPPTPKA